MQIENEIFDMSNTVKYSSPNDCWCAVESGSEISPDVLILSEDEREEVQEIALDYCERVNKRGVEGLGYTLEFCSVKPSVDGFSPKIYSYVRKLRSGYYVGFLNCEEENRRWEEKYGG